MADPEQLLRQAQVALAGSDPDQYQIKSAISDLTSAVETHMRRRLAAHPALSADERARVVDLRANRPELIRKMLEQGEIGPAAAHELMRFSAIRNAMQHRGATYHGTLRELEAYAALVEALVGGTARSAAIDDALFEATMASLGMGGGGRAAEPPEQEVIVAERPPRPTPERPAARAPFVAPPVRVVAQRSAQRPRRRSSALTSWRLFTLAAAIVALLALWALRVTNPEQPPTPTPTPTLGLPAAA